MFKLWKLERSWDIPGKETTRVRWETRWVGGGVEEKALQGQAGVIIESPVNLDKEFGYYPKRNGKSLKCFKQEREMMRLVFLKDL